MCKCIDRSEFSLSVSPSSIVVTGNVTVFSIIFANFISLERELCLLIYFERSNSTKFIEINFFREIVASILVGGNSY